MSTTGRPTPPGRAPDPVPPGRPGGDPEPRRRPADPAPRTPVEPTRGPRRRNRKRTPEPKPSDR